ncbi:hypothetical protein Hanom_Chr12g01116241 [Helianthus anomalus]
MLQKSNTPNTPNPFSNKAHNLSHRTLLRRLHIHFTSVTNTLLHIFRRRVCHPFTTHRRVHNTRRTKTLITSSPLLTLPILLIPNNQSILINLNYLMNNFLIR